jgi:hypothetical protein
MNTQIQKNWSELINLLNSKDKLEQEMFGLNKEGHEHTQNGDIEMAIKTAGKMAKLAGKIVELSKKMGIVEDNLELHKIRFENN